MAKYNPRVGDPEEWLPDRPTPEVEEFEQLVDSELYLPRPTGKECRQLVFKSGTMLNVQESQGDLQNAIDDMAQDPGKLWLAVQDAQFGQWVSIPRAAILNDLVWIAEAWIDVAGAREQLKQRELANRMASSKLQVARLPVGRSNGRMR